MRRSSGALAYLVVRVSVSASRPSNVELVGGHRDRCRPPISRCRGVAVGIDLDAVAFGIVEIDGFADEVIGEARQRHLVGGRMHQPAREVLSRRHQECGVIEPRRVARLARRARDAAAVNSSVPRPRRAARPITRARHDGEPDHVAIVIGDQIEVAHAQCHHADPHRRPAGKGRPAAADCPSACAAATAAAVSERGAGEVKQSAAGEVDGHPWLPE